MSALALPGGGALVPSMSALALAGGGALVPAMSALALPGGGALFPAPPPAGSRIRRRGPAGAP